MRDEHLKTKARTLRERGQTLDEITVQLALPRTTIYSWIRDLPLGGKTPLQNAARLRASEVNRQNALAKREVAYQKGWEEAPTLLQEPLVRDFVVIYLTEGYRKSRNMVCVANSNPRIMVLSNHMMRRFTTNKIGYTLQHHVDQEPQMLIAYWSKLMEADSSLFAIIPKSNSGQLKGRNWRSEWGVLSVRCGDTYFRSRLQGWMDFLEQSWQTMPLNGA